MPDAAAVSSASRIGARAVRLAAAVAVVLGTSCSGPTKPGPPPPPVVGPATPPVIRSITVPVSRVEAGTDVPITAVIEDAETPLASLTLQWSASAGTITGGSGPTAVWRVPPGLTSGINVTVSLTVIDTYDAVVNNVVVKQQFVVSSSSPPFRVHDSVAEVKELARKFLVDLFGNSSVSPAACMVDFSDTCASLPEGKTREQEEIVDNRAMVVTTRVEMFNQDVKFFSPTFGTVHSATQYTGHYIGDPMLGSTCGDFEVTVVYVGNRWWICESYFNEEDTSHCPAGLGRSLSRAFRGRGKSR